MLPGRFFVAVVVVAVVEMPFGFGHPELGAGLDEVVDGRRNDQLLRLVVFLRHHVEQKRHELFLLWPNKN